MAEDIWQHIPYPTPHQSVFEFGWVRLEKQWQAPQLAGFWLELRQIRAEVNKVLERARAEKAIGSSLEAKTLLYIPASQLRQKLELFNPSIEAATNGVDELRYLFLTSQVELLETSQPLEGLKHSSQSDTLGIGIVNAEGQKCDRCWNYSVHVGEAKDHPLLCERCISVVEELQNSIKL